MAKIDTLNKYIQQLDDIISRKTDWNKASGIVKVIVDTYEFQVKNVELSLEYFEDDPTNSFYVSMDGIISLKARLENYRDDLELEIEHQKNELRILELKQIVNAPNYYNSNISDSHNNISANANASNNITITIEQTLDNISRLSEEVLPKSDKDLLEQLLATLELNKKNKDKDKMIDRVGGVLKFITDKSVQVGIAVLPYLGKISEFIQSLQ